MPLTCAHIEESLSTSDEDVKVVLSALLNLNLQDPACEKLIVNITNKYLSVSKTRSQGLEILNLILSQCSNSVISENGLVWISHCVVKHANDNLTEVKLHLIGKIVEHSKNDQEFGKKILQEYLSKIVDSCISSSLNVHEATAALEVLTVCMAYYSSWFTVHKEKIENFLIIFLESSCENLVEKAATAFIYLQQVGGSGIDGINHRNNFSRKFSKLCATVQELFDKFLENEVEIDNSDRPQVDVYEFPDLTHRSQKMVHITARRITNCLKFLKIMLLKCFPVAKDIKPMDILDIVSRGTALHHCLSTDNEKPLGDFQFSLLLNKVQIQLLQLLRIFIIWLQESALPFSFTISKILVDCLKKIQSCPCFTMDSQYQDVVYKALCCWLRVSKNSFHSHFQTQLVTCVLKDITPVKTSVTLSLQTDTKNKSAKAKRKIIQERIIGSGTNTTDKVTPAERHHTEQNCLYALSALKQYLLGTTVKLKQHLIQELYTTVINSILDLQSSKFVHPYTNNSCHEKLYEVLVAFYEQETLKVLPPLQLAINILNKGINHKNRHIALTCEQGLNTVEKLCQPVCPSLFIPDTLASEKHVDTKESYFDKQILEELAITNNVNEEEMTVEEDREVENLELEATENNKETNMIKETTNYGVNEVNEEIDVVTPENDIQQETNNVHNITREKSINIIDVKVVQTSIDLNLQENEDVNEILKSTDQEVKDNAVPEENVIEITALKTEVLSYTESYTEITNGNPNPPAVELSSENSGDKNEPPSKKLRLEDQEVPTEEGAIKEETKSNEEMDDIFEDGAFVDEVKEY